MRSTLIARIKGQPFGASARVEDGRWCGFGPGDKGRSRKRPRSGCGVPTAIPGITKNSVLKSAGVPLVEHPCPKMESGIRRTEASSRSKCRCRLGSGVHDPQWRQSVAFNFGCVGRAAACGAVTWFAVLRNFELTKNDPRLGKNRWSRFFCLPPQPSCVVGGQALAIAPPCRSATTFMIVARSWALISKPASISRRRTISAAASGSRIGTGKSSLSKRSTSSASG
jgi:hypothetical protein